MSEAEITFKPLIGSDEATDNLVKAYEYEIKLDRNAGYYCFEPKMQLPNK